nr:type III-B CRISPR module-associated protein Cmr5 [uncultured Dethiosulfovibrio sp.]
MTVTREQRFAQRAFKAVSDRIEGFGGSDRDKKLKEYKSFVRSFPALIQSCGLAQALAFAISKKHGDVVEDLMATLDHQGNSEDFQESVRNFQLRDYMRKSREAMDAAGWVKRYADGLIEDKE